MRHRLAWFLGALATVSPLALALTPPARASVVEALDMRALVHAAQEIVVGTTRSSRSRYEGSRIVTESVVVVEERMRGGGRAELRVLTLGGVVDGIGMRVEGAAQLPVGERALLFLRASTRTTELAPVGMAQGVLPILEERSGRAMVQPGARGLSLMRRVDRGQLVPAPGALHEPRPLDELRAEIEALIAADAVNEAP